MSNAQTTTADTVAIEVDEALSGDAAMQTTYERVLAGRIFIALALVVVLAAVIVALFGLPALTMIGLAGTVVVFALLIAYAAGF